MILLSKFLGVVTPFMIVCLMFHLPMSFFCSEQCFAVDTQVGFCFALLLQALHKVTFTKHCIMHW